TCGQNPGLRVNYKSCILTQINSKPFNYSINTIEHGRVTYFDGRIAERLGHSSTLIIDKIYADLTDVTRNDDIEKFEEYIEKYL
ncbi:MAG: hypothetical protein LKI94_06520, partial [Sporolactobacillus sp.]|nr:hypothetical protein [Sporolactobacillus sp.]